MMARQFFILSLLFSAGCAAMEYGRDASHISVQRTCSVEIVQTAVQKNEGQVIDLIFMQPDCNSQVKFKPRGAD